MGGRDKGGGLKGGERSVKQQGRGEGFNVKVPLQRPAKSLEYMENTRLLRGNRTTFVFLQT